MEHRFDNLLLCVYRTPTGPIDFHRGYALGSTALSTFTPRAKGTWLNGYASAFEGMTERQNRVANANLLRSQQLSSACGSFADTPHRRQVIRLVAKSHQPRSIATKSCVNEAKIGSSFERPQEKLAWVACMHINKVTRRRPLWSACSKQNL